MDWIHARSACWGIALTQTITGLIVVMYCAYKGEKVVSETNGISGLLLGLGILATVLLWRGWR